MGGGGGGGRAYGIGAFEFADEEACVCCGYAEGFVEEVGQIVCSLCFLHLEFLYGILVLVLKSLGWVKHVISRCHFS